MGVKGLWRLIEEAGTPVPLESLENKILAVDVSIWLHQAVRGFRGIGGDAVANSHLLTLFHRICKLLFYRIKPVFVFDGGVPHLKKQTQSFRRVRREAAANRVDRIRERLLNNLLKSHAVRQALGKTGPAPSQHRVPPAVKPRQKDMFELPPLPEGETLGGEIVKKEESHGSSEGEEDTLERPKKRRKVYHHKNLHNFDLDSEEFRSLPMQKQHEILVELQDSRKDNSWASINSMPSESSGFASYQMQRLLKRFKFQETMDNVRSAIQKEKSDELEKELFGDLEKHVSQTHKIASEDAAHSIFITKETKARSEVFEGKPTKVDKGKSLMKKPQKDFLQELMKEGIIGNPHRGISDSEESSDDDAVATTQLDKREHEDDALVHVMNYAMSDNNGLSQDEILRLIQQSKQEVDTMVCGESKPSTSRNATGVVCNTQAESSDSDDDDDFVEVPAQEDQVNDAELAILSPNRKTSSEDESSDNYRSSQENNADGNNIDAIRSSKSSSLYIKIVQHRLDDVLHEDDASPRKAKVDSRKLKKVTFPRLDSFPSSTASASGDSVGCNGMTLTIDVTQPKLPEEDIFADVFLVAPRSLSSHGNGSAARDVVHKLPTDKNKCNEKSSKLMEKMTPKLSSRKGSPQNTEKVDVPHDLQSKVDELVKMQLAKILKTTNFSDTQVPETDARNSNKLTTPETTSANVISSVSDNSEGKLAGGLSQPVIGLELNEASSPAHSCSAIDSPRAVDAGSRDDSDECSDFIEVEEAPPTSATQNVVTSLENSAVSSGSEKMITDVGDVEPVANKQMSSSDIENGCNISRNLYKESNLSLGASDTITPLDDTSKITNSHPATSELKKNDVVDVDKSLPARHATSAPYKSSAEPSSPDDEIEAVVTKQDEKSVLQNGVTDSAATNDDFEAPNEDDLKKIEEELAVEQKNLVAQAQKGDRIASNLSQQMYTDAQEMLQLFGLPYLVAPMEAEAQCAFLDEVGLTNGTITDDSDAFLFGSKHVYKNFFNQSQHVELYKLDNIRAHFGLDRNKLIALALLTGSDYTVGIEGIGAVSGMEILTEFPGMGIEILRNFKKWWVSYSRGACAFKLSKLRDKLGKVYLPEGFPNDEIFTAYLEPDVDHSREKFEWSIPNTDALREFTAEKLGWSRSKTNEILIPVMKRLSVKSSQTRIDTFFNNVRLVKDTKVTSKRLQDAIAKSRGDVVSDSTKQPEDNLMSKITREHTKKRKATPARNKVKKNTGEEDERHEASDTRETKKPRARQTRKKSIVRCTLDNELSAAAESQVQNSKKPLSKEEKKKEIYRHLLQKKEEIAQRKAAEIEMQRKKQQAALLLKKKKVTK